MPKLEKIYRIKDIVRRHKILVRYAEALKVHLFQAQKANGDYDYDKLTVLVFDAESARYKRLKKDMFIFCWGLAVFIIIGCGIFILFQLRAVQ